MSPAAEVRSALRLTRPGQWPILTAQLLVGMLLAAPSMALEPSRWTPTTGGMVLAAWAAWVVLLNGGTLAFNSAYDRDTGPVAYLRNPPQPPSWLAAAAVVAMASGSLVGALALGRGFGLVTGLCVLLSILYSHPAVRLKARPGWDLLTNMVGYGAGTTAAGFLAGLALMNAGDQHLTEAGWWFVLGFGLLFGSFYPLTQIYQVQEDRQRGDRTLATCLGTRWSLVLALGLGVAGGAAFWNGLSTRPGGLRWPLLLCLGLWLGHLLWWLKSAPTYDDPRHEKGMYIALGLWALADLGLVVCWMV